MAGKVKVNTNILEDYLRSKEGQTTVPAAPVEVNDENVEERDIDITLRSNQPGSTSVSKYVVNSAKPNVQGFTPTVQTTETVTSNGATLYEKEADKTAGDLSGVYSQLMSAKMAEHEKDSKALARRSKAQEMAGGITDAANALASMYHTTKGAEPTYDPSNTLQGSALARYQRLKAELDKDYNTRMTYLQQQRLGNIRDQEAANAVRRLKHQEDETERKYQSDSMRKYIAELNAQVKREAMDLQRIQAKIRKDVEDGKITRKEAELAFKYYKENNETSGKHNADYTDVEYIDENGNKVKERTYDKGETSGNGRKPYPVKKTKRAYPIAK